MYQTKLFQQELLVKVQRQSLAAFKNETLLFQGRQSLHTSQLWPIRPELISLYGMLVHRRVTPQH